MKIEDAKRAERISEKKVNSTREMRSDGTVL